MCINWYVYGVDVAFDGCRTRSPEVAVRNFKKVVSFVVLLRKRKIAHQTAERIYAQYPVSDLPVTSCQEPRSVRVYGTEKRNVIVAFRCRNDVEVPRSSVTGEVFGDRNNVLFLHRIGMAQSALHL